MITKQMILTLNPRHPNPQAAADALQQAAVKFGITDPRSVAAWIANIMTESNLVPQREDMYYTKPETLCEVWGSKFPNLYNPALYIKNPQKLGNLVYANREGNGDIASGDGYRFRGGGFIQRTFKNGYLRAEKRTGLPFSTQPELMEQYGPAAMDAAAYWTLDSTADKLARAGDIRGTRRAVNGPKMLHADKMLGYYARVLPLVQAAQKPATPVVKLVVRGGGKEVVWDGASVYDGLNLVEEVPQLCLIYPTAGGPWVYKTVKVWRRQNGELVLERVNNQL